MAEYNIHIVDGVGMLDQDGGGDPPMTPREAELLLATLLAEFEMDVKRIQGEGDA